MSRVFWLIILLCLFDLIAFPQAPKVKPFGWDLTYATLLERDQIPVKGHWLNNIRRSPIEKIIEALTNETIVSAIFIERPLLGEPGIISNLFVRTRKAAYFWELKVPTYYPWRASSIDPKVRLGKKQFERMAKDLDRLEQATPVPAKENGSNWDGYWGVLNTYRKGSRRQVLLTIEDFYELRSEFPKPGRVALAMDKAVSSIPAPSALVFAPCAKKPTKEKLVELFGAMVACPRAFSLETGKAVISDYTCFSPSIRVRFDEQEKVTSIVFDNLDSRYLVSRVLPAKSWLGFSRNRRANRTFVETTTGSFSEHLFEDDCATIRTAVSSAPTGHIPGSYTLTWK